MDTAARRAVLGSLLAGGLVSAGAAPAEAAGSWTPRLLPAKKLRPGDLIVGPDGTVVRVASRTRLDTGRQQIRYTHPNTGEPTPMTEALDVEGYPGKRKFVVLLRDVGAASVTLTPIPPPTDPNVVDGGAP
jgi:hypothetical protein